jgi:thioredoxin reductase (NADPH)
MSSIEKVHCLIIGSGPAGYTAAIYAARADMKPVMYQGLQPGGQLTTTNEVENFPGYPNGISGPEMMVELEAQAKRFDTDIRFGFIEKVDFSGEIHKCWADDGKEIHADTVIISTGASAKYLGLESEQKYLKLGGGVSACAVCDGFFYRNQEVVIVGAGDSACEEAHYLSKLCTKVTMLVRKDFRASKIMADRVKKTENIEILYNTETLEVIGDGQLVTGVRVFNNVSNEEKEILKLQIKTIIHDQVDSIQVFTYRDKSDFNGFTDESWGIFIKKCGIRSGKNSFKRFRAYRIKYKFLKESRLVRGVEKYYKNASVLIKNVYEK